MEILEDEQPMAEQPLFRERKTKPELDGVESGISDESQPRREAIQQLFYDCELPKGFFPKDGRPLVEICIFFELDDETIISALEKFQMWFEARNSDEGAIFPGWYCDALDQDYNNYYWLDV